MSCFVSCSSKLWTSSSDRIVNGMVNCLWLFSAKSKVFLECTYAGAI
jgi:hypothetical protein